MLFGILSQECFSNLILLVVATERLLMREVIMSEIEDIKTILIDFLREAKSLYSEKIMLGCFHELLHLPECALYFGHLNSVNCFPFEENNRKIVSLIKGRDLVGDEFFKLFSVYQELNLKASEVKNHSIRDCLKNLNIIRSCNLKIKKNSLKIYEMRDREISEEHLLALKKYFGSIQDYVLCHRILKIFFT